MKKTLLILTALLFVFVNINSQIIITEINYNSPDQDDVYEYLELFNSSEDTININGYQFIKGIKHTFDEYLFPPNSYLLLAKDSTLITEWNINAIKWQDGGLKNKGETLILADSNGVTIDSVSFDDGGEWVSSPDGDGPSLELCDLDKDNANGKFWKASINPLNKQVNGKDVFGTPGFENSVSCQTEVKNASLVINEIFYNDGIGKDSLEFIEIFNNTADSINLDGFRIKSGTIDYTLPPYVLKSYKTVVISNTPNLIQSYFNVESFGWGQGGLNNKADTITLYDSSDQAIDKVEYFDDGNWPNKADGEGYSLSLCDANSDNNVAFNWQASPVYAGFVYKGNEIHANPGYSNYCTFDIDTLKKLDTEGSLVNKYYNPFVSGTVYGINFNPDGLQFVIKDDSGKGIWTYSHNNSFGYTLHEGDKISLWGKMNQFKGLTQIRLDSVILNKSDSLLNPAKIVEKLDESTEGDLVTLKDVRLLDYTKWTNSGKGFNVKVANSKDTFAIRIDADTDIFGKAHPVGTFDVTGLGGQYDKNSPFFDGYQLLPRYIRDIDPYSTEGYPIKKIGEVTEIDAEGKGISVGTNCELRGLVYGINIRPSGLQFTIIDELNDGIGVFSFSENFGYEVTEGDYISVKGNIDQYKGLLQIKPDTILLISTGHTLYSAQKVTKLGEETESQLVTLENLKIKEPSEWKADGSSFNVTITNGTDDFVMRIDNDVELSTSVVPDYTFNLTGIGGQYDPSSPFDSGYQILPRYATDIEKVTGLQNPDNKSIEIYPNPVSDYVYIRSSDVKTVCIYSLIGIKVKSFKNTNILDVKNLKTGMYKIVIETQKDTKSKMFLKL